MNYKEKYKISGVVKSVEDKRDYQLSKLIQKSVLLPKEYINPTPLIVLNQGSSSCCVACAISQSRHLMEYIQSGDTEIFSPMYIYGNRKVDDYHGEGMMPREALSNLKNFGICHKKDYDGFFSYQKAVKIYRNNKKELDSLAYPYRISSYYRLNTIKEIKEAIYTTGNVLLSYNVHDCFFNPIDGVVKCDDSMYVDEYNGHEVLGIGFNEIGIIICNSWGEEWGNNGTAVIPYEYAIEEAWCCVDDITEDIVRSKYKLTLWDKIKSLFRR